MKKPTQIKIIFTKYFPIEYLNSFFSKQFKIHSEDFILRKFNDKNEILANLKGEKNFITTSFIATKYILELPISGNFYCVGETSANLIKKEKKEVFTTQLNADNLAKWIVKNIPQKTNFVYFCSKIRNPLLKTYLTKKNYSLKEIITYNTLLIENKLEENYNAYVFFSPSGVKSFHKKNKIPQKAIIFAIGKTTEQALKNYDYPEIIIPEEPKTDLLLKKIQEYYGYKK